MKTVIILVSAVLLALAYEASALRCACDPNIKCPKLDCPDVHHVRKLCGCCDECAIDAGTPCSTWSVPCKKHLWCIKKEDNKVDARKSIHWAENFDGVCGYLFTWMKPFFG